MGKNLPIELKFPFKYEKKDLKTITREDPALFTICDIKEKEVGIFLNKKLLYTHFDGELLFITIIFLKTMKIKNHTIKVTR